MPDHIPRQRGAHALIAIAAASTLTGCYVVDTTFDAPDANPGDGICARALTPAEQAAGWRPGALTRLGRSTTAPKAKRNPGADPGGVTWGQVVAALPASLRHRLATGRATPEQLLADSAAWPAAERETVLEALREAARLAGTRLPFDPPGDVIDPNGPRLCTLRAAIMEANAQVLKSYITVPAGTYHLTVPQAPNGAGGWLLLSRPMRIQGAGVNQTIIDGDEHSNNIVVDASPHAGVVEVNHLTVLGSGEPGAGGGFHALRGQLEIEDAEIRDNRAFTGGAGMAIASPARVTVRRTTISGNVSRGLAGGGIWNSGQLWLEDSTLEGNQSNRAGAISNNPSGQMVLRNVTISGNRIDLDDPFGAAGVGGIQQNGFAALFNVTITGNEGSSDRAGGISTVAGATTVMKNSIVAGNLSGGGADDCKGKLSGDSKYNLIGNATGCEIPSHVSTFVLDTPAQLGPLAWNGGPTRTHMPNLFSPALEAGYGFPPPAVDACQGRDQRGVPRPLGQGVCDLGAVEFNGTSREVTGFVLVDAATDTDIRPLRHDDWLNLGELPSQLSVRATIGGVPVGGSVIFGFDGDDSYRTENSAPYALGGDAAGDYAAVPITFGDHELRATPYTGPDGTGAVGVPRAIRFSVYGTPN